MAGKLSNGIVLKMGATATPNITIGKITSFDGPGGSAVIIDSTDLSSAAMEKVQGLRDEGQFSFDVNYDPADTSHKALVDARAAGTEMFFSVEQGSTKIATFKGFVNGFQIKGAVNALIAASVTLEVTGVVTWGTATV